MRIESERARQACKKRPRGTRRSARAGETLLTVALAAVLIGCAGATGWKLWELRCARQQLAALQARMNAPAPEIVTIRLAADAAQPSAPAAPALSPEEAAETPDARQRRARLAQLRQENAELIGWITLADTPIDYPVMQSVSRPWHYLDHDFTGARSKSGLPFLDEACDAAGNRANWIIYAHNMKNGTMFGGLHALAEEPFYSAHRTLTFDTPERAGSYRVVSVFYMTVDPEAAFQFYRHPNLGDAAAFDDYAANVLAASLHPADTTLGWGDELLTLVTCVRGEPERRLVVVAKRMD